MNSDDIFKYMQMAVEAAQTSEHSTSQVGACLVSGDISLARPNFWPKTVKTLIGKDKNIGNSSGTVHAETACILDCETSVEGSFVFSTDPSCPNCAKNMAEAGVRHLYIDHKGFEKYFAKTRMKDFEDVTVPICRAAGMGISHVYRKDKRIEEFLPESDTPDFLEFVTEANGETPEEIWQDFLKLHKPQKRPYSFALCKQGDTLAIACAPRRDGGEPPKGSKYNFNMQPLTRLLMVAAREGLEILPSYIFSSRVPTSRELVNFIGGGYQSLHIANTEDARDEHALEALRTLRDHGIINIAP